MSHDVSYCLSILCCVIQSHCIHMCPTVSCCLMTSINTLSYCSAENVNCVTPTATSCSSCPQNSTNCTTLSEYAQEAELYFTSNKLVLISWVHVSPVHGRRVVSSIPTCRPHPRRSQPGSKVLWQDLSVGHQDCIWLTSQFFVHTPTSCNLRFQHPIYHMMDLPVGKCNHWG